MLHLPTSTTTEYAKSDASESVLGSDSVRFSSSTEEEHSQTVLTSSNESIEPKQLDLSETLNATSLVVEFKDSTAEIERYRRSFLSNHGGCYSGSGIYLIYSGVYYSIPDYTTHIPADRKRIGGNIRSIENIIFTAETIQCNVKNVVCSKFVMFYFKILSGDIIQEKLFILNILIDLF